MAEQFHSKDKIRTDSDIIALNDLEYGYKEVTVVGRVNHITSKLSKLDKKYSVLTIEDNTGITKILNLSSDLKLESGKLYSLMINITGHPYKPGLFLQHAVELKANPSLFVSKFNIVDRPSFKNMILDVLTLKVSKVEEQDISKNLVLLDKNDVRYFLKIWANNAEYDLDWTLDSEVRLENCSISKKSGSNYYALALTEFTTISFKEA